VEAAVHATRRFLENISNDHVVVKLDFRNAFNTIRRDVILEQTHSLLPEMYSYVHSAYSTSSVLFFGDKTISSDEGVQQGDPLGPLLFCLSIQPALSACTTDLRVGYLDDITLGGSLSAVSDDVERFKQIASSVGLYLNNNKCELITNCPVFPRPRPLEDFKVVDPGEATLLGSSLLTASATDFILKKRLDSFMTATSRLGYLQAHDALVILKHSLSVPSLLHNLRTSYLCDQAILSRFDVELRRCLSQVLNISLDDSQWMQASLPVKDGGLGIRKACQLAPSAFLASAAGSADLISEILPSEMSTKQDNCTTKALAAWHVLGGNNPPVGQAASVQRNWDAAIVEHVKASLIQNAIDDYSKARLQAVTSPHAGEWLNAPPLSAVGLRMSNEVVRVAVGLRLGAPVCAPHECQCGANVDARGSHGLSCSKSAGRHLRHSLLNEIVCRSLVRANIAAVREPTGLMVGSGLRPDGVTLIPWARGKCLAWDATTPDTLAASHLGSTSIAAGGAASHAATVKLQKYNSLLSTHLVVPLALETLGPINEEGLSFLKELGRRLSLSTNDPRETSFLFQRLSVAVQRGNAASVVGTLPSAQSDD
jgi:hypothetical protein